jgi:hypothetical protein
MSKEKLAAAKQFIQEKQYREARMILESTDHPKATEWLAKLPKPAKTEKLKNSPPSSNNTKTPIVIIGVVTVILLAFFSGVMVGQNISEYSSNHHPLNMTRTAIHHLNSTTMVEIKSTQTAVAQQTKETMTNEPYDCAQILTQQSAILTPTPT